MENTPVKMERKQVSTENSTYKIFRVTRHKLSDFGDAQSVVVAAQNQYEARQMIASLYTSDYPQHLASTIYSLQDIQQVIWISQRCSNCTEIGESQKRGILKIEIREKP